MNWLAKLFGSKTLSRSNRDFSDAYNAFATGKRIFKEAALIKGEDWKESQQVKIKKALEYFDEAIKKGFDESEVFSLRGNCLNDLGFYFDALEDYNKAIEKGLRKGIASSYHMRSVVKDSLFDFDGSIADLKEAIRLSKLENEDNAYWNDYARSTGFASQTAFYEMLLPTEEKVAFKKEDLLGQKIC